jgi:hypothetical protein
MIRNVLASVAAAGLVFAPLAAQASTRAGNAGVSMDALSRAGATMGAAEYQAADDGIDMWLLLLLFGAAGTGIILAIESGENNESPGT